MRFMGRTACYCSWKTVLWRSALPEVSFRRPEVEGGEKAKDRKSKNLMKGRVTKHGWSKCVV